MCCLNNLHRRDWNTKSSVWNTTSKMCSPGIKPRSAASIGKHSTTKLPPQPWFTRILLFPQQIVAAWLPLIVWKKCDQENRSKRKHFFQRKTIPRMFLEMRNGYQGFWSTALVAQIAGDQGPNPMNGSTSLYLQTFLKSFLKWLVVTSVTKFIPFTLVFTFKYKAL